MPPPPQKKDDYLVRLQSNVNFFSDDIRMQFGRDDVQSQNNIQERLTSQVKNITRHKHGNYRVKTQ